MSSSESVIVDVDVDPSSVTSMCEKVYNNEQLVHLWRGPDKIFLVFEDSLDGTITKIINIKDWVFFLTTACSLYYGIIVTESRPNDAEPTTISLSLKKTQFCAIDIARNSDHVFIVTTDGQVQKIDPASLEIIDIIVLKDDTNSSNSSYTQDGKIIKVSSIAVNDNSALFLTENGQLWASGDQPYIDIKSQEPKKVLFFEGRVVSDIACGCNFYVILLKKKYKTSKEDINDDNDEEDFVKSHSKYNVNVVPNSINNAQQLSESQSTNSISSVSSKENVFYTPDDDKSIIASEDCINDKVSPNNISECDKDLKKNVILLNTEAAKQFLTKQLSWVSSYNTKDEFQMDTMDNHAKTIKQNVSNMANFVYEGVKTVGDKVVTISRHVSGSSDNNDVKSDVNDSFEELRIEESKKTAGGLTNNLQSEDFPRSSSVGSSENEVEQQRLSEKINLLVQAGNNVLSTELWTWGDTKYGQLGIGDINKLKPCEITLLNHSGIKQIACGDYHTLALTLDGKVYTWGRNNFMQVAHCSQIDQKSPQLFSSNFFIHLPSNERAKDIATGSDHSLIMMDKKVFLMGKYRSSGVMSTLKIPEIKDSTLKNIFCSDTLSCCTITNELLKPASDILIEEQTFLDEISYIYKNLIIPFQNKSRITSEVNVYETLCCHQTELLNVNALNVQSLWDYYNCLDEIYNIIIIKNVEEFISVYKSYLNTVCDIISLSGFAQISKLVDGLQVFSIYFKDKISTKDKNITNEEIIGFALKHPLQHLSKYINLINKLIKLNESNEVKQRLQEAFNKWEMIPKEQARRIEEAECTKKFWDGSGKIVERFKSPERRLIRESRSHPISLLNSGIFSSHWFILLTDILIHISGTTYTAHLLQLMWVELLPDSDTLQNAISITTPEDNFILFTQTPADRSEWFHALQIAINKSLQKSSNHMPPQIRTSSFSFTKHSVYKDTIYTGQWLNGKLHGSGKLEWRDNRMYIGQFYKGAIHGNGRMEMPLQGVYEGQWKDGQQNGYGIMNYINGDVYEGYFKDGLPHGHGMKKDGHFMASVASVYIGEWSCGVKQGYGVMDDIKTGEKYLGSWHNNNKHGNGLIVTLDGIYYEGTFVQDVFTGRGIMVLEDGTHYEGEFKSVGIFGGKGILTFSNEDKLEGNFTGAWNEGIKVTAVLHINNKANEKSVDEPPSFAKLCTPPDQKWKAIFRQFYQQLGIPENIFDIHYKNSADYQFETQKLWRHVAVIMSKSERSQRKRQFFNGSHTSLLSRKDNKDVNYDQLNKILCFSHDKLTLPAYDQIHKYLTRAFDSHHHPLGTLLNELAAVYTATYGGVRVHPLLLKHAVAELRSITTRVYEAVTLFFPALPKASNQCILKFDEDECAEEKVISAAAILHPILLPRVYSALFVLYALHNKKTDDAYWERLIKWNKQPTNTLLAFLGIDYKFWKNFDTLENDVFLNEAIETLQQLKTTFSAVEKLIVIKNTHFQIEQAIQKRLENYKLPADELIPIFYFVVVRASVLQLGSEINFITDFMETYLMNGQIGYAFTTVMGIYDHILKEKITMDD